MKLLYFQKPVDIKKSDKSIFLNFEFVVENTHLKKKKAEVDIVCLLKIEPRDGTSICTESYGVRNSGGNPLV